jgi:hypothetical protein
LLQQLRGSADEIESSLDRKLNQIDDISTLAELNTEVNTCLK